MMRRHFALYLGSRAFAAVGNFVALAIFTRLAGPEIYGDYVVMVAAALVISGVSAQWLRYSFFSLYRSDEDRDFFASFLTLLAVSMVATVLVASVAFAFEGTGAVFAAGALLIGLSTALFEVLTEICRSRLEAARASLIVILRTILIIGLGSAALVFDRAALSLAIGIAAAHLVAALPAVLLIGHLFGGRPNWREARRLGAFGWPLLLAFGIGAFAQGADRFFLAAQDGAAATGSYGALADLVRASFVIVGEAISLSTVPLAKRQHAAGEDAAARATLAFAFRMLFLVGCFTVAGVLVFGPHLLPIVFPASFLTGADALLPAIAVGAFLLVLRNTYLAQVIYFTRTSWLELASAIVLALVNSSLCLLLVGPFDAQGAAIAFLGGQVAAGLLFLLAARSFRMPTPWRPALLYTLLCLALTLGGRAIASTEMALAIQLAAETGMFLLALIGVGLANGLRPHHLRRVAA